MWSWRNRQGAGGRTYLGTVVIAGGFLKAGTPAGAAKLVSQIIDGRATFAFAQAEPQGRYSLSDLKTTAARRAAAMC